MIVVNAMIEFIISKLIRFQIIETIIQIIEPIILLRNPIIRKSHAINKGVIETKNAP